MVQKSWGLEVQPVSVDAPSKVLVIIMDSMDRTKFCWPRYAFRKVPKNLEAVNRPRLVLTAAIAHGYATCLYVAQENVFHGADAFLEMLSGPEWVDSETSDC